MAATGMLPRAKAPAHIMPAQRVAMMSLPSAGALPRNSIGTSAHIAPRTAALVTVTLMARGDAPGRFGSDLPRKDFTNTRAAGMTTNKAQAMTKTRSCDRQNEATRTPALKIMASMIQGVLRSTPLNCSARI
jgi:hypothetical protein